ncbi:unnamed protein product [Sphagnum troendelagicum]|uniref:HSA domain-containing protein n=1 Tax=Sphagnum troendelagicum TaxID=128251 RepID=A0ABP0TI94_9BRYO
MYNGGDATRLYFESSECYVSSSSPVPKFEVVAIVNQCELAAFAYWSITDVLGSAHLVYLLPHYSSSKLIWGVDVSCEVEGKRTESGIELGMQKGEAVVLGPRAREDPGFVPRFEHSVNAEQGSMGAGAGAAVAIDHNEPSPHGTAIEKVLAELRWDLGVQEERRMELQFLEKVVPAFDVIVQVQQGGEPLDFQFREVPSLTFSSPSLAEPLADQLLFSDGDVGSVAKAISNGNAHESISSQALSRGRGVELEDCRFPVNARDAKDGTPSKGRAPQPSISNSAWTQINVTTKRKGEVEGSEDTHIGSRSPEYARRNKYQSQHLGNGHLSVKEQEKLVGVYSSLVVAQPPQPPVTTKDEAMVDMGFQVLPHESPHAVTGNHNGVPTNQELEPLIKVMRRCGADLEQHMADTSTDIEKDTNRAVLPSHVSLQSEDTSVNFQVATGEDDGSQFTGKGSNIDLFFSEERPSPHLQSFHELQEVDAACLQEHVDDKSLLGRDSVDPGSAREPSATGHSGHETPRRETEERVGTPPLPHLDSIEKCSSRAHQVASEVGLNMPPRGSMYERNLSSKEVTGTEGKTLPVTQVMLEGLEGVSFHKSPKIKKKVGRGTSDVRKVNRDQSAQDDKRFNASNARIKVEDVAEDRTKPSATTSELSSLQEHDPTVQAEAEKHRADISAKVQKAYEDIILEEAEHLQAASSTTVDQVLNKPWCEASRKKAHWDFVLEEMAWMANDFVQESLWKKAAAGQICRCVALQKQHEFLASQLCKRQQKVAKVLANLVNGFWHSVEVNKQKSKAIIQQYAMPFLKSSGFELMVQAEAPATPKRHSESISTILEPFWEDQFLEEPLFYVVSNGSMEVYRASVESDCTMLEAPPALGQQQSQKKQCHQMQQQQEPPPQRRLQMLHPGTAMGMPLPGQLGKVGMQQQGQGISSHIASQPGTPPYQHGNTSSTGTASSTSCPGPHIMPLSSGLKLSTAGVHALDWKSNQAAPPMSGGMFNLTRTSSPGCPTLAPSGVYVPSSSGNKGMSIHGASVGGLPQAHAVIQAMSNMLASQTPPPVQSSSSVMLPSSTVSLATSGPLNVAYQGVPAGGQVHSASMPGSGLLYSIQPHKPQICNMSSTGTAVHQRSATPASSGPALTAISTVGSTSPSVTSVVAGSSSSA